MSDRLSLEDVQALFVRAVAWPTGVADFLRRAAPADRAAFAAVFRGGRALGAVSCMEIYANAYFHRIHDALAEQFPLVRHLLGDVGFHNLVTDYLVCAPPRCPDLARSGDRLPAFLHTFATCRDDPPYLAPFARCEWAEGEALLAPDVPPLCPADLGGPDPARLLAARFVLHPSVRLLRSHYDYAAAARALAREEPVPIVEGDGWDLLVRPHHAVFPHRLPPDEGSVLLRAARPVGFTALAAAARDAGWPEARFAERLRAWLEAGFLAADS